MDNATFRLDDYSFTKASLNFNMPDTTKLDVFFNPKGVFHSKETRYELSFDTIIKCEGTEIEVINVSCVASFSFENIVGINDIPEFFYPNSLAILFPYIRAFVSTISLLANVRPIILPTINLMGIKEELRRKTTVVD